MSKIERFQGDVKAFASNAQGLERTVFGGTAQANDLTSQVTAAFLRGWGIVGPSEHPSLEDFNAAMYAMSQFIAYQHQAGVPEWHAEQEYHTGSICVRNGEQYSSLADNNIGSAPPSAKWTLTLTAKNATANIAGFLKTANNLSEIAAAGVVAQNSARTNLGIGLGALLPVGVPIPYPLDVPPNGYFRCMGQSFNMTTSPLLAAVYPSGVLPDLRGEFIRGWDNSRGVDVGRVLLSAQADAARPITGSVEGRNTESLGRIFGSSATGAFKTTGTGGGYAATSGSASTPSDRLSTLSIDTSLLGNTANENRPRSIAFNYIVRAA